MRMAVLISAFLFAFTGLSLGQNKYEQESKIRRAKFPKSALVFIDNIKNKGKTKYYKETHLDGISFESKFKLDGHKYSVEFNGTGELEDIERTIRFPSLDSSVQAHLCEALHRQFSKYRIEKIQEQWTGQHDDLLESIQSDRKHPKVDLLYELVVTGKKANDTARYELLLNPTGKVHRVDRIIERTRQNIEY